MFLGFDIGFVVGFDWVLVCLCGFACCLRLLCLVCVIVRWVVCLLGLLVRLV